MKINIKQLFTVMLVFLYSISTAQTFNELKAKAEAGDIESQYNLGNNYYYGKDNSGKVFKKNLQKSYNWFLKCAEQGDSQCQSKVAGFYLRGEVVNKNTKMAFSWYKKSANQDYEWAQFKLGQLYFWGTGVERNQKEAFKWFIKGKSEEKTWPMIARCYTEGKGTTKNVPEGLSWYLKSAEAGNTDAYSAIAYIYKEDEQLKDLKKAFEWRLKHAKSGAAYSQYLVGNNFLEGESVTVNIEKGIKWLNLACENNDSKGKRACDNLGNIYYMGKYVNRNYSRAFSFYKKAAEEGISNSMFMLGEMNYHGIGTEKKLEQAFYWYKKLSEREYAPSYYNLGFMYATGEGVKQNNKEAFKWFKKSAENGDVNAQATLGGMYYNGNGTEKDTSAAKFWIKKAADGGHEWAKSFLSTNKF